MSNKILKEIEAAIAQLQNARTLLIRDLASANRATRSTAKNVKTATKKSSKRRTVSGEGRERMRQAQLRRWATIRKKAKKVAA